MTRMGRFVLVGAVLFLTAGSAAAQETASSENPVSRWGVGLNLWGGGFVPAVHYNASERVVVEGSLGLYTAVTALGGQAFYRFPTRSTNPSVRFEPIAGGGLHLVMVNPAVGTSESLIGVSLSGGAFLHLPKNAHWRFKGVLSYVQFDYQGVAFRGIGGNLGGFYFF